MRLAVVVQRYGLEVNGGAELMARQYAEHLAPFLQIEVLTTCAQDYMTWANAYPAGEQLVDGVSVRRFPVRRPRDVAAFNTMSERLLAGPHSHLDEEHWMALQGPDAPEMFDYVRANEARYDLFVFFTYLYASTYVAMPLVAHKSLLWPTAHDEPWIHLDLFRSLFNLPRGLLFSSDEEEQFVRRQFHNQHLPGRVIGTGVEVPNRPRRSMLPEPYLLYLGRIDESKGCGELFDYFLRYKALTRDPLKLVLVGQPVMPVPDHPDIVAKGYIATDERFDWLQSAELLVLPSRYESLSLVTLEAMSLGVPVLVNAQSPVLRGHCTKSQAGLYYRNLTEFIMSLRLLRAQPVLRANLGRRGIAYVQRNYAWPMITERHLEFLRATYRMVYSRPLS
jgi:glycosyltransferase involved in cell wall biosynthesis